MVTEFLSPGTLSSDLSLPPKIFVMGESDISIPDDLVIDAFCFGPTSSQPPSTDVVDSLVGEVISEASEGWKLDLRTETHSSCNASKRIPRNSSASC